MSRRGLVLVVAALVLGAAAGWFARDFAAQDDCLDAGGAWRSSVCTGARAE